MLAAYSFLVPRICIELGVAAKMLHQQSVRSYVHWRPEKAELPLRHSDTDRSRSQSIGRVVGMSLSKVRISFLSL